MDMNRESAVEAKAVLRGEEKMTVVWTASWRRKREMVW